MRTPAASRERKSCVRVAIYYVLKLVDNYYGQTAYKCLRKDLYFFGTIARCPGEPLPGGQLLKHLRLTDVRKKYGYFLLVVGGGSIGKSVENCQQYRVCFQNVVFPQV